MLVGKLKDDQIKEFVTKEIHKMGRRYYTKHVDAETIKESVDTFNKLGIPYFLYDISYILKNDDYATVGGVYAYNSKIGAFEYTLTDMDASLYGYENPNAYMSREWRGCLIRHLGVEAFNQLKDLDEFSFGD